MFNKVSYRRGILEGVIFFSLGRLLALIDPVIFPDWTYVAAPLLFLTLQYIFAPFWATRRITSTKRERLSKRFWLLGPRLAALCFGIDFLITLAFGMPISNVYGSQHGSALLRLLSHGPNALSLTDYALYEVKSAALLFTFYTMAVICTRLAMGGFLRFTMPAGGNRVTL
jgi:hypothetical protein